MRMTGDPAAIPWYLWMGQPGLANFGDELNEELSGCVQAAQGRASSARIKSTGNASMPGKILGIGSVLEFALRDGDIVLGAGYMDGAPALQPSAFKNVTVLSTRGRLSAAIHPSVELVGDPALYLPYVAICRQ